MNYLYEVIDYIEKHIACELQTESLANLWFVSRRKLYYDFYNLCGHSVKDYIRKRRLSTAAAFIKCSQMELSDIAYYCGYSSQQELCRIFKRTIGLTPAEYKSTEQYWYFPPFRSKSLLSVTVNEVTIPDTLCMVYRQTEEQKIEINAVQCFLDTFPQYDGRIFGRNGQKQGSVYSYELHVSPTGIDITVLNNSRLEVKGQHQEYTAMFATSTVQNEMEKINDAWDYLYSDWMQNSMFTYKDQPYFEEYIVKQGKPAKVKLYLPIVKRVGSSRIRLIENPNFRFLVAHAAGEQAERKASRAVIDCLAQNGPQELHLFKEFYVQVQGDAYTCGVLLNEDFAGTIQKTITLLEPQEKTYCILESDVMGNYQKYLDDLSRFAYDNGLKLERNKAFAIYDTKRSSVTPKVRMVCPIQFCTK